MIWEIRTEVKVLYAELSVKKELLFLAEERLAFFKSLLESAKTKLKN
jgi:hypothetical protein